MSLRRADASAPLSMFSLTYILRIPDPIRGKVRRPVTASATGARGVPNAVALHLIDVNKPIALRGVD